MSSDNQDNKKQFSFGKFGKIVIRKYEISKSDDGVEENKMTSVSPTGAILGSVSIAAAATYSDDLIAGATGVPY